MLNSVLIIDRYPLVVAGLKHLLETQVDMRVVDVVTEMPRARERVRAGGIDTVIIGLAEASAPVAAVRAAAPEIGILVLADAYEASTGARLVRAGAGSYLPKRADGPDVLQALRALRQGRRFLRPEVEDVLMGAKEGGPVHETLSEREFQVFIRMAKGETTAQIAKALCIADKTVTTYRGRVSEKMKMHTASEMTYYALRHGLIE